jgi:hypothetical protein
MISHINPYFAGITALSAVFSAKSESPGRSSFTTREEESKRPGASVGSGPTCSDTSGADTKLTISGSVVYEPVSLLADLSGSGAPRKMTDSLESFSPLAAYKRLLSEASRPDNEAIHDPVTYTFEILV